jgi:integrase
MHECGCRISEALMISKNDITLDGKVYISGKKGSLDRVNPVIASRDYLLKCKLNEYDPFTGMNRFTARRHLLRIGISKLKKGRINESVTHIFRDEFVKDMRSIEIDESVRSRAIGHKSVKSTSYYGKD